MSKQLALRYAARSDIGLVRQGNEDSGYAGGHMLVVADGMGGHAAGELASATAIATFAELDRQPPGDQVLTALADAVDHTHEELSRVIAGSPDFAGMGTTITAISWEGDRLALIHVGDSRAYLLRDGELHQLTHDHTYVQTLVDSGRITRAEAAVHEKRNLLMKALDGLHPVEPDLSMREVRAGDRFLLCTDGLSGVMTDAQLQPLLANGDATGAVTALVEKALEAGAPDNVTCLVADVVEITTPDTDTISDVNGAPVVVGAAAEPRNRDRLPGIDFPSDSQPDPDRDASKPAATITGPNDTIVDTRPRRRSWRGLLIAGGLGIAIAVVLVIGITAWFHSQYYVGEVNGRVGIYQGISGGPGPHGLSRAIQTSQTQISSLPTYSQEQVRDTIPAKGLDGARETVSSLEAQAAQCQAKPATVGCPSTNPSEPGGVQP